MEVNLRDKVSIISVGSSWIDSRLAIRPDKKQSQMFLGCCHYSSHIWAISPLDYQKALLIKSIAVSPSTGYCEKAQVCLHFDCWAKPPWIAKLNHFNKFAFAAEFKDCGLLSLGLPQDIGTKPLWFNTGKWEHFWDKLIAPYKPDGVVLYFDESKNYNDFSNLVRVT